MSNPFGWLTPSGCGTNDTGPMGEDDYKCEVCGRTCTQGELDPGANDPVCRECKALREEEEAERVRPTPGQPIQWHTGKQPVGATHVIDDGGMIYWSVTPQLSNDDVAEAFRATYDGALGAYDVTDLSSGKKDEYSGTDLFSERMKVVERARVALALARGGAK